MKRQRAFCTRGYTLIEVMIVTVVAAILVISALPDPESSTRRSSLEFMYKFEADISYAKSLSIARPDEPLVIKVDTAADAYWLAKLSAPDTPILHPRTKKPYVVTAGSSNRSNYPGVDIVAVDSGGTNTLVFNSTGGIDVDSASYLQVTAGQSNLQLEISNASGGTDMTDGHTVSIDTNIDADGSDDKEGLGETVDGLLDGLGKLGSL